jgi:phenylalanyl-tRNA synthetase beta subunit
MSNFYQDKIFSVKVIDNSYYEVRVFENQDFTVDDLAKLVDAQKNNGGVVLPVLVICENNVLADVILLSKLSQNEYNPYSKADAFVLNSMAQKILANFYIKINKPERPTKFFNNADEALIWLKQYM